MMLVSVHSSSCSCMGFVNNPDYPLSELTQDVIAGFYRTF